MVQFTLASGKMVKDMEGENNITKMELFMKDIGETVNIRKQTLKKKFNRLCSGKRSIDS